MSRSRKLPRAHSSGWTPVSSITRTGWSWVAVSVVLVLVVAFALALNLQQRGPLSHAGSSSSASSTPAATSRAGKPLGSCGSAGQPACVVDPGWIDLPSESPAVVAQTIFSSGGYGSMTDHFGGSGLDVPALVHAYQLHTGVEYYDDDHWVVSQHDETGLEVGVFDFVYDRMHHRIRLSSFGSLTPEDYRAHQAFPYTSATAAVSRVQAARGVGPMAGRPPELMFFPIDPRWGVPNSPINWGGGGNAPMEPMWHVVGADGRDYFVGVDSRVYVQSDLPLAPGGRL